MDPAGALLSCRCGSVRGSLRGASAENGSHVICHCSDCRALVRFLGATEALDRNGGSAVYQTLPGRVTFTHGGEFFRCLRLSESGILRCYSGCCSTPLSNTLATPRFRYVSIPLLAMPDAEEVIGPATGSFVAENVPEDAHPADNFGFYRAGCRAVLRHLSSVVCLAPGGSPYFADGKPVAAPYVLTGDERTAAYRA